MFKRGAIILVPFPFTDLSSQKIRPALIISDPKFSPDTVTVVFISSITSQKYLKTDILIKDDDTSFEKTGLKKSSLLRCHKIASLDKKIVLGEMGSITKTLQKKIDGKLRIVLGL